jgi:GGDEF domain-containing protein
MYPEHGSDSETLLQAADVALYEAKRAGRDRLVVFGNV